MSSSPVILCPFYQKGQCCIQCTGQISRSKLFDHLLSNSQIAPTYLTVLLQDIAALKDEKRELLNENIELTCRVRAVEAQLNAMLNPTDLITATIVDESPSVPNETNIVVVHNNAERGGLFAHENSDY